MSFNNHVNAALSSKSILVTDLNGSGEDVMVFTNLDAKTLEAAYRNSGKVTFGEIYEVPNDDVQFYIYEPCWLSEKEESQARKLASKT